MKYVIIGSGPAGIFAAEAIRRRDTTSPIILLTEENAAARSPVMLTHWIAGQISEPQLLFRDSSWAEKNRVNLRLGQQVVSLQAPLKKLTLTSGEEISYDRLLVAAGSSPLSLPIAGVNLPGVKAIRKIADAQGILDSISPGQQVLIIGGGLIGLKLTSHLKERGLRPIILEKETKIAPRLLDQRASSIIIDLLRSQEIRVETGVEITAILEKNGRACGVRLKDGRTHRAPLIIQCLGVRPNTWFLSGSGIEFGEGIPVNPSMETNIPGVYAAGDVTMTLDSITQKRVNNATWPAAARQGTVAGTNMAGGDSTYRHNFPINAIQLFRVPVLTAGHYSEEKDVQNIVEEDPGSYRKFFFRDGRLIGFILIGEISGAGFLLTLLKKQERVSGKNLALRPFPYQERLPPGWGYEHGALFLRTPAERS